jgi:L-threonylcarbamoyladenylate synthase
MASANGAARYCGRPRPMRILAVDRCRPDPVAIAHAATILRQGGLVAFPTETVYGLGARAFDERALAKVFAAKGRPEHHPLIAHVTTESQARELAADWTDMASRLALAFWPGPLTLVLRRAAHVPAALAGGGESIAIRSPEHPVARALIAALGEPVAAPSANRYQGVSPTLAAHVVKELPDAVDLVLDGGSCDAGIESTVVDVRGGEPRVLRLGALPHSLLRDAVGHVQVGVGVATVSDEPRPSPGLDARHYAPRARLVLVDTADEARRAARALAVNGASVGVVVCGDGADASPTERSLPMEPQAYARRLYATLHELDDRGVEAIVVQRVPITEAWWAVADRLARAATPRADGRR